LEGRKKVKRKKQITIHLHFSKKQHQSQNKTMSVIIEFTQIENKNIKSENKICGIYEVERDKIN